MGHLHLILNHAPIVGLIFSIFLAGYGFFKKDERIKVAALWAYVIVGVATGFAYITGEPAEKLVEHMATVNDAMVEAHVLAAGVAGIFLGGIALLAALELWHHHHGEPLNTKLMMAIVLLSVIAIFPIARASYLGGVIGHPEIRPSHSGANHESPGIEAGEESGEPEEGTDNGMPEPANR